ncbi:hypothetical protein [Roseateles saccharophilus]|uniref:Uncharacterized protein n=1 Tax=Roseateles saccharophilus TaxID=304 RepID=A0A4R3U830_ROSSA|nr:hypothetical protein [Roseateles saccharophilus]MDG0835722.1 hypothetical protein [Roseateles saccharophilus]TCU84046.1 hypothetical protein EV671_10553 [Roseateles saccharophilus]
MSAETIDHTTLMRLVEAQAVRAAHVIGQPGGWSIVVKYGMTERPLAATRSREVRIFKKLETLVGYLKDMGVSHFDVNAADYDPKGGKTVARPDTSAALKRAHEAAAHDKWFREQVADAIAEADAPGAEWIPHELVKADMAKQRAALQKRIAKASSK